MAEYKLITTEGRAKRGEFKTVHGTIQTPVFMNVGTIAAIKGAVSTVDLHEIGTQVELSNTYHLHVRPGDKVVKQLGGLHEFMNWDRPQKTSVSCHICKKNLKQQQKNCLQMEAIPVCFSGHWDMIAHGE